MSYKSSPFKMAPKSPAMKALKGEQVNLPEGLKKAIEASPAKQTNLAKQAAKGNRKIDRDRALADRNPERATKRGEKLEKRAANMPQVKNPKKHPERNQRRSDKRQESLVRAKNIEYFFVPNSKKNK